MRHVLLLLALGCAVASETPAPEAVAAAPVAPGVEMIPASQVAERLAIPSEKTRIVNFWATWCGPCVKELPRLAAFTRGRPDAELVLVNLDIASLQKRKVDPFIQKNGLTEFANWQLNDRDPSRAITKAIPEFNGVVPLTLVVRPNASTRQVLYGAVSDEQLDAALQP